MTHFIQLIVSEYIIWFIENNQTCCFFVISVRRPINTSLFKCSHNALISH